MALSRSMALHLFSWRRVEEVYRRRREGETLKAIGDSLGVSPERVRQLESRMLRHLREATTPYLETRVLEALSASPLGLETIALLRVRP